MLKPGTVRVILLLAGLGGFPAQAWEGKEDNKAAGALERLTDRELCQEADQVCRHAAPEGAGRAMEGLEYIGTLRQAAEKRYGKQLPAWLTEAASAIAAHEPQRCPAAACTQLRAEGGERRTAPAAGEPPPQDPLSGAPPEVP